MVVVLGDEPQHVHHPHGLIQTGMLGGHRAQA